MALETIGLIVNVLLGVITLLGVVWAAYTGYLQRWWKNIDRIPKIEDKVDNVANKVDENARVTLEQSIADHRDDVDAPNPAQVADRLNVEAGVWQVYETGDDQQHSNTDDD